MGRAASQELSTSRDDHTPVLCTVWNRRLVVHVRHVHISAWHSPYLLKPPLTRSSVSAQSTWNKLRCSTWEMTSSYSNTLIQGCTTYFTRSSRNISGREVGGRSGGLRLCPQWGPGAKPLVRGSGDKVPLKLMTIYWYNSKMFALIAMFMQKSRCD